MNDDENSCSSNSNFSTTGTTASSIGNVDFQYTDSTQDQTLEPFSNFPSRDDSQLGEYVFFFGY